MKGQREEGKNYRWSRGRKQWRYLESLRKGEGWRAQDPKQALERRRAQVPKMPPANGASALFKAGRYPFGVLLYPEGQRSRTWKPTGCATAALTLVHAYCIKVHSISAVD